MIRVTKLNDMELVINADFIELIQSVPDTTITLSTGQKIIVKESVDEIIDKIADYKKSIII
ncbi:MAG: flagellar FlbD family protein [bacterium]